MHNFQFAWKAMKPDFNEKKVSSYAMVSKHQTKFEIEKLHFITKHTINMITMVPEMEIKVH